MAQWLPSQYAWAQPQAQQSGWAGIGNSLSQHSNLLLGLGAGLLSGDLGAAPQAIAAGAQADRAFTASKKADAERQDQINRTAQWVQKNYPQFASLPPDQAYELARAEMAKQKSAPALTTDQSNFEYSQTHPGFTDFQTQKGGPAEMSLQPTWMKDAGGNWFVGAQTKDGRVVKLDTPDGMSVVPPADVAGAKAGAGADAKSAAAARAALPGAEQAFDLANKAADTLLGDTAGMADQFGNTIGFPNQMMPMARPGSDMARFRSELEQGQGNAFLQARQVLKGAGQVTDYEGAKAEAAYSRMALAAKNNNQQEFIAAVQEFKQAVNEGYEKLKAAAQGDYAAGGPGITGGAGGDPEIDSILKGVGL